MIPIGLTDMLQDFTVEVLRQKPDDLVAFAARYFNDRKKRIEINVQLESRTSVSENTPGIPAHQMLATPNGAGKWCVYIII